MTAVELRAKIRELMASGVLPSGSPLIERPRVHAHSDVLRLCLYFHAIAFNRSANRTAAFVSCSPVAFARAVVV